MDTSFPIKVLQLEKYYHDSSIWSQSLLWYRLLWLEDGRGMLFVHAGKEFHLKQYRNGGWMVMFSELFYYSFLECHPQYHEILLFNETSRTAFIPMDKRQTEELTDWVKKLRDTLIEGKPSVFLQPFIDFLLLHVAEAYTIKRNIPLHTFKVAKFKKLNELIHENYRTRKPTSFYAEQLNISPRALNDICKKITGRNLPQELNERRIAQAQLMLISTAKSIKEIALELGYDNQGHFATYFKKLKKMSPRQYRFNALSR